MQITLIPTPGYMFSDDTATKQIFAITYNTTELKEKGLDPLTVLTRRLSFTGIFYDNVEPPAVPLAMADRFIADIENAIFESEANRRTGSQYRVSNEYFSVIISKYEDMLVTRPLVPTDPSVRELWGIQSPGTVSVVFSEYGSEAARFIESAIVTPQPIRTYGTSDCPELDLFAHDIDFTKFSMALELRQSTNPTIRDIYLRLSAKQLQTMGSDRIRKTMRELRTLSQRLRLNVLIAVDFVTENHSASIYNPMEIEADRTITVVPWASKPSDDTTDPIYDRWNVCRGKLRAVNWNNVNDIDIVRRVDAAPEK